MKKNKKLLVILTILMFALTSCIRGEELNPDIDFYRGEHPELYTVAMNSLLGQRGFSFHSGPRIFDSTIRVLEEDAFGRRLFIYSEDPRPVVSRFNLLISQKSDVDYVYFIPHYNFISSEEAWTPIIQNAEYPLAEVEEFKRLNDWNQPLDLERAVRVPIIRRKEDGPMNQNQLVSAYRAALGDAARGRAYGYITFFNTDDYGRSIYTGRGLERREDGNEWIAIVMLFQPDGSHDSETGSMKLPCHQNYQSALREFKELNNWNQPLEE